MTVSNLQDSAVAAVSRVAAEHADDVDRASRFPRETLCALQQHRLMHLLVPEPVGGPGAR